MNRRSCALLFAACAAAVPMPAQAGQPLDAEAVVILQFGAGDLVLNEPLTNAIVNEPACRQALEQAFGEAMLGVHGLFTRLPAPHLAGTFQIHVHVRLRLRAEPTAKERTQAIDLVLAHLRQRLETLLHGQPQAELQRQRDELRARHASVITRRSELLARQEAAAGDAAVLRKQRATLAEQLLEARLHVATEERAAEHLLRLRADHTERRNELRGELEARVAAVAEAEARLGQLRQKSLAPDDAPAIDRARAELDGLDVDLRKRRALVDAAQEALRDAQSLLSVVLEQLPGNAMCQQKANSRLETLTVEQRKLDERLEAAAKAASEAARLQVEAEQLQIEASVCSSMLVEVQGKLARLRPLGWQVLHQH
jgi:hypothetical protein